MSWRSRSLKDPHLLGQQRCLVRRAVEARRHQGVCRLRNSCRGERYPNETSIHYIIFTLLESMISNDLTVS